MKNFKLNAILIAPLLLACVLTGCDSATPTEPGANEQNTQVSTTVPIVEHPVVEAYRPPADFIKIDRFLDDPSNDEIIFEYDEDGRIVKCYYKNADIDCYLAYSYSGAEIHIYGFSDGIIVADENFEATSVYDSSIGFVEKDGYYFHGFEFK